MAELEAAIRPGLSVELPLRLQEGAVAFDEFATNRCPLRAGNVAQRRGPLRHASLEALRVTLLQVSAQ